MSEILRRDIVCGLKKPRSGWPIRGIEEAIAETVFFHVKKLVRAAKIYAKIYPELDGVKLQEMALYHDIAEYKEKDYLPGEITLEEKHRREKAVIEKLRDHFYRGGRIYEIWMEYEDRRTPEAIATKQLDIMDTAVQALHYAGLGYENVHDFFPWAQEKLQDPLLVKIWNILTHSQLKCDIFEQYFLLLELKGNEELFYQEMYRRVFESWKKDCLQMELNRAISAGDKNFTIGYAMLQIQLSGGEIHDDSLRAILGDNYPVDFTLESFESVGDEVEYYQLNFGNKFHGDIEKRCGEIFQRGRGAGYITRADEMVLRFLFSSEELLPISEMSDAYIKHRQSGAPQFFVSKETLLEWVENGRKQEQEFNFTTK